MKRFSDSIGAHYAPEYLVNMTDKELEEEIKRCNSWESDLLRELCYRANMLEEWEKADENFEKIAYEASKS